MMIADRGKLYGGIGMMVAFSIVLVLMFSPIFKGYNGLQYLDSLYNSISKGSAYYIPRVTEALTQFKGDAVSVTLKMPDEKQAEKTALLFTKGGAVVTTTGAELQVSGDLGRILANCVADSEAMYHNDGNKVANKYGYEERQVLFNWWQAFKTMEKALTKQKKFKEAEVVALALQKAVEPSYNYYKIEAEKISDRAGVVVTSLLFYVFYTVWYGFAILFIFEGWGLRMGH